MKSNLVANCLFNKSSSDGLGASLSRNDTVDFDFGGNDEDGKISFLLLHILYL